MLQDSSVAIEDVDILVKAHHEAFFSQFDLSDFAGVKDEWGSLTQDLDLMSARRNYSSEIRAFTLSSDTIADQ